MATVMFGAKEVGSIVNLNVDGTLREFIVVHQGKPGDMYDDSCDGTWLLLKDVQETMAWMSSRNRNNQGYDRTNIHPYLNGEWLKKLDASVREQVKSVKIPYIKINTPQYGDGGLECKVFLLSHFELGGPPISASSSVIDGEVLPYFQGLEESNAKRIAYLNGTATKWWLRSMGNAYACAIEDDGSHGDGFCDIGLGVRPALIFPSSRLISDDGTVTVNAAPVIPENITIPEGVQGGISLNITWGAATDPDGDPVGYELERQVDGGDWTQVYKGEATSYTDTITRGWLTVAYRVRAYDSYGAYSDYTTSPTREVNNNRAPAIVCTPASGSDLGTKTEGFTIAYTTADADGDPVTVTEAIDGATLRTFTPEGEESCTFALTGETFMKLLNGAHELSITASDGQAQAVHTLAFTKSVTAASITLAQPMEADGPITLCVLSVTGSIPEGADYSVQVTNNALDDAPVWEDCTDEVKLGANHVFTNDTAANGFAFNFKVEVERGESGQGGYINSVQGGFQ